VTIILGGERFRSNAYFGTVDPDSDVYYCATATGSLYGNTHGVFTLAEPGGSLELAWLPDWFNETTQFAGDAAVYVLGSYVFWERWRRARSQPTLLTG
jgi:hypothetical protein